MKIGTVRKKVDCASEFLRLAKEDEAAALLLERSKQYRHAAYFIIQSMEKFVRFEIFKRMNPNNKDTNRMNRSHSVEDAIDILVDIVSRGDTNKREHIATQLRQYVLGDTAYTQLHNNLRYPFFSERQNSYSVVDIGEDDCKTLFRRLNTLKNYLADLVRI
jgi:hypothetical protein